MEGSVTRLFVLVCFEWAASALFDGCQIAALDEGEILISVDPPVDALDGRRVRKDSKVEIDRLAGLRCRAQLELQAHRGTALTHAHSGNHILWRTIGGVRYPLGTAFLLRMSRVRGS